MTLIHFLFYNLQEIMYTQGNIPSCTKEEVRGKPQNILQHERQKLSTSRASVREIEVYLFFKTIFRSKYSLILIMYPIMDYCTQVGTFIKRWLMCFSGFSCTGKEEPMRRRLKRQKQGKTRSSQKDYLTGCRVISLIL